MSKAIANKKCFAGAALLFALATVVDLSSSAPRFGGTSINVMAPAGTPVQSGPTLPPGPWDEGKRS